MNEKDTTLTLSGSSTAFSLPDEDILAAMREMSGYFDITPDDFREIYQLAHAHVFDRLFADLSVRALLKKDLSALRPELSLTAAAEQMAKQHAHTLPVVDDAARVIGTISEPNFLRPYGADTFFAMVFELQAHDEQFLHYCERTQVAAVMTVPPPILRVEDDLLAVAKGFHERDEQRLAVVDENQCLMGVVLRRDFLQRFHLQDVL
ncbi:CBS domain-containing protein [Acidihalobacter aeolianus]|nr:CBS domain-containing protein [Acidihalobacter aeolianus]